MSKSFCKFSGKNGFPDVYFESTATSDSLDVTGTYRFYPNAKIGGWADSYSCCFAVTKNQFIRCTDNTTTYPHYCWTFFGHNYSVGSYFVATEHLKYKSNSTTISDIADSSEEYDNYFKKLYYQSGDPVRATTTLALDGLTKMTKYNRSCFARTGGTVSVIAGNYFNYESHYYMLGETLRFKATPSNANYGFSYWEFNGVKASSNNYFEIIDDEIIFNDLYNVDLNVFAVFSSAYKIEFNSNGGRGVICSQSFVSGCSQNLTKNNGQITRSNHTFVGWNTRADGSGTTYYDNTDGSNILIDVGGSAGDTITLYAMWSYTAFDVSVTKVNSAAGGSSVASVGTLTLVDMSNNSVVAQETSGSGVLYYEGTAGKTYKLYVALGTSKPDVLWNPTGVFVDGSYVSEFQFTAEVGEHLVKNFLLTEKSLCSLALAFSPADSGSTASIVSPSEPDKNGKYAYGREIVVGVTPAAGYEIETVRTTSGYEYSVSDGKFTIPSINSDDTATIYVKKSVYRISVSKDSPSSSAITAAYVDGSAYKDANYGDTVVLTASVASGYAFDGWYDGDTLLSTSATYSYTVTGAKNIVAKAKVSVKMSVHYTDAASYQQLCTMVLNGSAYTPGSTVYVTLGTSVDYELVLCALESGGSDLWKFNAWFNAPFTDRTNPLALGISGSFTPTSSVDVVAEVTPTYITNVLTILMKEDENQTDISRNGIITTSPAPDAGGWDSVNNCYKMTFYGTKEIVLTSSDAVTVGSTVLAFNKFVDGSVEYDEPSCRILSNGTKTITAWYGSTGTRNTTLGYGIAGGVRGDRTMGAFAIVASSDPQATISDDGSSATVRRGYTVTIMAKAKNGYKFNGWFTSEKVGGTPYHRLNELTFVVSTSRSLYAWFSQDASAVYEWEGSGNNKSIEWRSKTFVGSRPFNPSCCRIDTEGYPIIEFDVDMFSAPDTVATSRSVITNVASQTARRIPVRRMERYLQVCVKNDHEVDAIFVGTNMTELAQ